MVGGTIKSKNAPMEAAAKKKSVVSDHAAVLYDTHSAGQNLVLPQIRRLMSVTV
jgi:hypothetical protein